MITKELLERCTYTDSFPLRAMPKVDLHSHALLSAPLHTYQELSPKELSLPPQKFDSLKQFLDYLQRDIYPCFEGVESFQKVVRDALTHMISDGIVYCETSFPVGITKRAGCSWKDLAAIFRKEIEALEKQIRVECDLGVAREEPRSEWEPLAKEALQTGLFSGIDIFGDELAAPISDFAPLISMAKEGKLRVKYHCGEVGTPKRMQEELICITPSAVQHGIAAAESEELQKFLILNQIHLNVCPTSNVALSVVADYRSHPIQRLHRAGVNLTLGSDDFGIFGRRLSDEYLMLYQYNVLDADALEQIRQFGLEYANWSPK